MSDINKTHGWRCPRCGWDTGWFYYRFGPRLLRLWHRWWARCQ